jgi:hypothetical protein
MAVAKKEADLSDRAKRLGLLAGIYNAVATVAYVNNEDANKAVVEALRGYPADFKKDFLQYGYAQSARVTGDSPDGFALYYRVIYGNDLPKHARNWIEKIYQAKAEDRGALLWAFRGSWKTSTLTIAFGSYRIGCEPEKANLIVQVNDDSATKSAAAIANIIENNLGWAMVFPSVVPDKERGWSSTGYEVKDTRYSYEDWRGKNATRRDPTLVGFGIGSGSLIGRHPDGFCFLDDIHDEKNTVSPKERQSVTQVLKSTILPAIVEDETKAAGNRLATWFVAVGTPWTEDDAYHYLKSTGEYEFLSTPALERCADGEGVEITGKDMTITEHTDLYGWWRLNWPEHFSKRIVVSWRNKTGKREFARMYLLDLSASNETGLKYHLYPQEKIDFLRWPGYGGADYASVIEKKKEDDPGRDYFAMAYTFKMPALGAVCYDGVFEQCTQADGEAHLKKAQGLFPGWQNTVVEGDGKGEEFITVVMRNPGLKIVPMTTHGKGKKARLERQLGPLLESGMLMVSDGDTPFLTALRKSLDEYPNWHLDPIDALYWSARSMPEIWTIPEVKAQDEGLLRSAARKKADSPWAHVGRT